MDRAIERAEGWARGMLELSRAAVIADRDGPAAALQEVASNDSRYSDSYVQVCLEYVRDGLETDPKSAAVRHGERIASS
jgi:hypothetical protein